MQFSILLVSKTVPTCSKLLQLHIQYANDYTKLSHVESQ